MKQTNKTMWPLLTASALACISTANAGWTAGHGDLGIEYKGGGKLEPHWHLGEGSEVVTIGGISQSFGPEGQEFEADELIAFSDKTETRLAGAQWDFLGISASDSYFVFPQDADPAYPWIGIGTEELTPGDWTGNLSLTLTGMTGPGEFSLYQVDGFGTPTVSMASSDGITAGDSWSQAADDHTHHNWAFTEAGTYNLTFDVSGTHAVDGAASGTATFTFVVPEPSSAGLLLLGSALLLRRRR